jgi:hypothetical protein
MSRIRLSLSDKYGKKFPQVLNDIECDLVTLQQLCRESGKKNSLEEFERNHQQPLEKWTPSKRWSHFEGKMTRRLSRRISESYRRKEAQREGE